MTRRTLINAFTACAALKSATVTAAADANGFNPADYEPPVGSKFSDDSGTYEYDGFTWKRVSMDAGPEAGDLSYDGRDVFEFDGEQWMHKETYDA